MIKGMFYQISKEDYMRAIKSGAKSIIGSHERNIISADVEQAKDGTYWLSYIKEVEDRKNG